jgi:hypothetical protein
MPRTIDLQTPIRRSPRAVWREFDREIAVVDPRATAVRVLNEVGARCWQLADGRTFAEILEELLNEYHVERNQLEADMRAFLAELDDRGLLEQIG